jgi:hypothetical protein
MKRLLVILVCGFFFSTQLVLAQTPTASAMDAVSRIQDEGMKRSELMKTLTYLTDVIGPRLTNSPNFRRAATWTRDELAKRGLANSHLEAWGPFGRGWSIKRFSAEVVEPQEFPLIAYPLAWSPGTNGELTGDVIYIDAKNESDLAKLKGQLKGKIALLGGIRQVEAHFEPLARRWNEFDMLQYSNDQPYPTYNSNFATVTAPATTQVESASFRAARLQFLFDEGVAVLMTPSPSGDGGTIYVQSASVPSPPNTPFANRLRPYSKEAKTFPQLVVSVEQFNRMVRMIQAGEKLKASVNLSVQFDDSNLMSSHTIADIPGTDLKDEIVMMGAHLDSWHSGTGATDNGAGVAVMMEAARILAALQLKPRRTIRIALWGGEENAGGSRFYVKDHFGEIRRGSDGKATLMKGPEYDKLSAYLNLDAGTGKIRGVFLADNDALRPILRPWLEPFRSMGASTLTINGDWGSDFVWFDQIGLPIVSFIQDEIEYETRTHHSNQDVLERIQPEDLKQAAVIVAAFAYDIAMRDEKLPHKQITE